MAEVDLKKVLDKLLHKIAAEHNFVGYDIKVEPVSSGGANYTSTLNAITITEGGNTHHLFAKIAAMGEEMRAQAPSFYSGELFVYTNLSKVYDSLQNHHEVPQEHRLILSKFYGCHSELYEEIIVLENLVAKKYESFDRFKSIDWEYAASAVTEMAKLHALSCAYSEYHPEDFKTVFNHLKFDWDMEHGPMGEYFKLVTQRALNVVTEKYSDKLKRFFERFGAAKFRELFSASRRPMLVHGDFRPSNLMHRPRDDGKVDIKVLDLQTMQEGSPVVDLLYFIFIGSDEEFRAQYYEKLIDHYYTELAAALKRLHLDPEKVYSRADFDYELKEKLPFGLTIAVFALPIVTVAEEDAPKVDKDLDMAALSIEKTSDLFSDRLHGILNDYDRWGVFNE